MFYLSKMVLKKNLMSRKIMKIFHKRKEREKNSFMVIEQIKGMALLDLCCLVIANVPLYDFI